VVVAALATAEFVARQYHRRALRKQQRAQHVALLPLAQRADRGIVGRPLDAVVPRTVVGIAVLVVLAVRLVVLVVIGDGIVQREAVMRGDEVDAGPWFAAAAVE